MSIPKTVVPAVIGGSSPSSLQGWALEVIKASADGVDGLTSGECEAHNISKERSEVLRRVLGKGIGMRVTEGELAELRKVQGDDKYFEALVTELAKDDGNRALRERVKWLGDNAKLNDWSWEWNGGIYLTHSASISMITELGEIGPLAEAAIPDLVQIVKDKDKSPGLRNWAAIAMGKIGSAAVPVLIELAKSEDLYERKLALVGLGFVDPRDRRVAPVLIAALNQDVGWGEVAEALGKRALDAEIAIPALLKALDDPEMWVHIYSMQSIALLDPEGRYSVPGLAAQMSKYRPDFCQKIVEYLAKVGVSVIPTILAEAARQRSAKMNGLVEDVLVRIGAPAVPILVETLKYRNSDISWLAKRALIRIGTPSVDALTVALRDKDDYVRRIAAEALGRIVPAPKEAIPALQLAQRDRDVRVRENAMESLSRIESDPQVAVATDEDVLKSFANMGPAIVPQIIPLIKSRSTDISRAAKLAIIKFGAEAVPALVAMLEDKEAYVRSVAAELLGELGRKARVAESALRVATRDRDPRVSENAKEALVRIFAS